MKKILIAAALLCITVAACKKDDDNSGNGNPTTASRKDTLSAGKWRLTSATGKTTIFGKDTTVDVYASFDACAKDDYYLFGANGKVTNDQGAIKCDTSGPQQTDGGTWAFNTSSDTLRMSGGTLPGNYRIQSFSNTSMQLQTDTNYSGFPFKLTATFQHN